MRSISVVAMTFLFLLSPISLDVSAQREIAPPQSVWTVFTEVQAEVHDNYAIVQVIANIGNEGPDPEFPFQVQIPDGAYVTGLTIERDGVLHTATIEERAAARQAYDAHKAIEETGGLVEKQRGYNTYAYLINVAEFTSVQAILTYEQYVAPKQGVNTLALEAPVSGFGRDLGASFDATVHHSDGLIAVWGNPSNDVRYGDKGVARIQYSVGPRPDDAATPFDVNYMVPGTSGAGSIVAVKGDERASFVHRLRAPDSASSMPIDLVLVMDTSGSMSGQKIAQLQDAARQLVGSLTAEDRLHVAMFSSQPRSAWPGMQGANRETRQTAIAAIDDVLAGGGTNIEDAIKHGFSAFEGGDPERVPILIFLTDGLGRNSESYLRDIAVEENEVSARVFGIAFGSDADWGLVAGLAEDGGGRAIRVQEGSGAEVDLADFMTSLTAPVLRDVRVHYDGDVTHYRIGSDVLFAGGELLIVGTMPVGQETLTGELQARDESGTTSHYFEVEVTSGSADWLHRLVAGQRIRMLEELADDDGSDELLALALEHGFVTDMTSLVLLLDQRAPCIDWCDPCPVCDVGVQESSWTRSAADQSSPGVGGGAGAIQPFATTTSTWTAAPTSTSSPTSPQPPAHSPVSTWSTDAPAEREPNGAPPEEMAEGVNTPAPFWLAALALAAALWLRRRVA